jgi:predicted nuclease with RNAse H fold
LSGSNVVIDAPVSTSRTGGIFPFRGRLDLELLQGALRQLDRRVAL